MEISSISRERMNPNSSEYKERYKKTEREKEVKIKAIFGAKSIEKVDEARSLILETERQKKEISALTLLKKQWSNIFEFEIDQARLFVTEMFSSDSVRQKLEQFFISAGRLEEPVDTSAILGELLNEPQICCELPEDIVEEATRKHVEKERQLFETFEEEELPGLMERVDERIVEAIDRGLLPIPVERWYELKENLVVVLQDSLLNDQGTHGSFGPDSGIKISPELSTDGKFHTLLHEVFHSLGGKKVNKVTEMTHYDFGEKDVSWTDVYIDFDHQRNGLSFSMDYPFRAERFRWFDEGMTEQLTLEIGKFEESELYPTERELLGLIIKNLGEEGKQLLLNAYFENFNPNEKPENRHQHLKKLIKAIEQKLGPRFLVKLDMFIYEQRDGQGNLLHWGYGVEKATTLWQKHGDGFPEFLDKWITTRDRFKNVTRELIEKLESEKPNYLEGAKPYDFEEVFEKLWSNNLESQVPHPSTYELSVIKDMLKKALLKKVRKQQKR